MFSTGQLENLICDAINIIVDKKVKKAHYNTTILGQYNHPDSEDIFQIGCGTSDIDRQNANLRQPSYLN